MGFLILIVGLCTIVSGIMLLVTTRDRKPVWPIVALGLAALILLIDVLSMFVGYYGPMLIVTTLPLIIPISIVMGIGLARERRGL